MTAPRTAAALAVLLLACEPAPTSPSTSPAPTPDPAPEPSAPPTVVTETVPGALPPTLAADPPPGIVTTDVSVDLVPSDPDATIVYTLDGRPPEVGVSPEWTGPVLLDRSASIRAIATNAYGSVAWAGTWLRADPTVASFSSDLPVAVLWSNEAAPVVKTEVFSRFTVSTFEPDFSGRTTWPANAALSTRAGLKIRGSSSAGYPKHPYRLETWRADADLDTDVVLLGMPEEADWVLGAPLDFDRALMRDPLMFALSNAIGRTASRTEFAELFVAELGETVGMDDYVGVYVFTERIERDADRVAITPLLPTDLAEPEVTGGYIFKEDRLGPGESGFTAGTAGGRLDFQQPFVFVDPNEDELAGEQKTYLSSVLDDLGWALASPDFTNPNTGHHYADLIDVDAWIDHHILNVLSKNPDSFRLSGFFTKDREGPIAAGPLWDFDRTMGCASDSRAANPTWWDASNETSDCTYVFDHGFWRGLFADPAFRDAYFARWRVLLDTSLSVATIDLVIDGMAAQLTEAAVRNYAAWPAYPPRGPDHAAEVATLKTWLHTRHAWIDGCLDLPDPRACPGS